MLDWDLVPASVAEQFNAEAARFSAHLAVCPQARDTGESTHLAVCPQARDTGESSHLAVCPIERILLSQQEVSTASFAGQAELGPPPPLLVATFVTDLNDVLVCLVGKEVMAVSTSGEKVTHPLPVDGVVTGAVFATAELVAVFSDNGKIGLVEWRRSGKAVATYHLQSGIKSAVRLSANGFVVATADDSLYIVKIVADPTAAGVRKLAHQLMIAPTHALGQIACLAVNTGDSLAVVGSAALLVLDMQSVEKPRVVFKLVRSGTPKDRLVWTNSPDGRPALIVYGPDSAVLLKRTGTTFDPLVFDGEPLSGADVVAVASTNILVIRRGDEFVVGQVTEAGGVEVMEGAGHCVPDLRTVASAGGEIVSVSVKKKSHSTLSLDCHRSHVVKWRELVFSLVHSERWENAMALLSALRKAQLPLLLDTADSLFEPIFIESVVTKASKAQGVNVAQVVEFAALFRVLPTLTGGQGQKTISHQLVLETVLEMVVAGRLSPLQLTHEIVSSIVETCTSSPGVLDKFVASIVLSGVESGTVLIDTNVVVRQVTALDLKLSVVLLHVYLLHDLLFPLKYWLATGCVAEAYLYLHCVAHSTVYPTRAFSVKYPSDLVFELLNEEQAMAEKLLLADPALFLNSIGYRSELLSALQRLVRGHSDLAGEVLLYGLKAAIREETVAEFFRSNNRNEIIQLLVQKGEITTLLNVLDHVGGPVPDLENVFKQLVASTNSEDAVLKFTASFADELDLEEVLKLVGNSVGTKLLCQRGDFDRATAMVDSVRMAKFLTQKYASLVEEPLMMAMWKRVLKSCAVVDECAVVLASTINCAALADTVESFEIKLALLKLFHSTQDLIAHATVVSAIDVGAQFAALAKHDSARNKAVTVTASMCHVCLDPVRNANRNDVMLFSCGHLVHVGCGDTNGCPVCV